MSILTEKIEMMKAKLDEKIAKMAKVELDKRFAILKKKYPFIVGVVVVVGMGSWTFRTKKVVKVYDDSDGTESTMELENLLEAAIRDLSKNDSWVEIANMANEKVTEEINELLDDYEEAGGGDFVI